jgi:nuclear pore complex protein Nup160
VPNIEDAIRAALDVVGGFDTEVKREEEVELLIPPPPSEWRKSMISTNAINTVDARYEPLYFYASIILLDDLALYPIG